MSKLETITGSLVRATYKFEEGTIRTSAELTTERRTNRALRSKYFWTNNFALYRVENTEPILYFGGRENNPIFKYLKGVSRQLIERGNYVPPKEDLDAAIKSALRVQFSHLNLQEYNEELSYFVIRTESYGDVLNGVQRKLAEKVYDEGKDFDENMKMLSNLGIKETRIFVLTPSYIKSKVNEKREIVRVGGLGSLYNGSCFNAGGSGVGRYDAVRGVLRVVFT